MKTTKPTSERVASYFRKTGAVGVNLLAGAARFNSSAGPKHEIIERLRQQDVKWGLELDYGFINLQDRLTVTDT